MTVSRALMLFSDIVDKMCKNYWHWISFWFFMKCISWKLLLSQNDEILWHVMQLQQSQISDKFACMIYFSFLHVSCTQLTVTASIRSIWVRTRHFFSFQQVIFQLTRDLLLMSTVLHMFTALHFKFCDCFDCTILWFRSINLTVHAIYITSSNQESQNNQTIHLLCDQTYINHDSIIKHFHHWLWFWFSSNTCIITCSQRMLLRLCDFSVQHLNWWKAVTNLMMSHV